MIWGRHRFLGKEGVFEMRYKAIVILIGLITAGLLMADAVLLVR